jgi:hypothetical protein|tara:strand:+ start:131 stop:343 length:213 start_codon:yes stop_codon:yes gene_type:complete
MVWAYYTSYVLPNKVVQRNRAYKSNYGNAAFASAYFFYSTFTWALTYKILWPEEFEFSIENIKTRGYGPN